MGHKMTVADVMSQPGPCISTQATMQDSMEAVLKASYGAVLVVDDQGRHVGVLSALELLRSCLPIPRGSLHPDLGIIFRPTAGTLARRGPTLSLSHTLEDAGNLFLTARVEVLPVVDKGRVVGIISVEELLRLIHIRTAD